MTATPLSTIHSWVKLSTLILAEEPRFTFVYRMFFNREKHPCWKCGLWNNPIGNCISRYPDYSQPKCGWIKDELNKVTIPFHKIEQIRFSDLSERQIKEIEEIESPSDNTESYLITEKLRSIIIAARMRLKLTHKEETLFDLVFEYPYLFEYFFTPTGNLPKNMSDLFNEFTVQLYFKDNKSLINAIQRLKAKFREVIDIDKDRHISIWDRIEVRGEIPDWNKNDKRYNPSYPRIMRVFEQEKKDYSPIYSRC